MLIPLKNLGLLPNSGGTLLATPGESQATPLQILVEHIFSAQSNVKTRPLKF